MVAGPKRQLTMGGKEAIANRLHPGTPIFRGEMRRIGPTPKFPNPSTADLAELLPDYLSRTYSGRNSPPTHTVGTNWTPIPEIAQRFVEPMGNRAQPGVPMGSDEAHAIRLRELVNKSFSLGGGKPRSTTRAISEMYEDLPDQYMDLSGPSNRAKPFLAGIIWHGTFDPETVDPDAFSTNYEKEIVMRPGASMTINGATVQIPRPGETGTYAQANNWDYVGFSSPLKPKIDSKNRWIW